MIHLEFLPDDTKNELPTPALKTIKDYDVNTHTWTEREAIFTMQLVLTSNYSLSVDLITRRTLNTVSKLKVVLCRCQDQLLLNCVQPTLLRRYDLTDKSLVDTSIQTFLVEAKIFFFCFLWRESPLLM